MFIKSLLRNRQRAAKGNVEKRRSPGQVGTCNKDRLWLTCVKHDPLNDHQFRTITHPLIPVMRKIRLPLILVQLTNLSMLLASTV